MKTTIKIVLLILLVGGLASAATYEYLNRPQTKPAATVSQRTYNSLYRTLQAHDAIATVKQKQLTDQITAQDSKLANVCGSLKSVKLNNSNCPQ